MYRSNNLMPLTWILVIALALLSLFTFILCADDIVGPRIQDDKEPDAPEEEEEDPNEGGGGMVLSRQIVQYA